MFIGLICKSFLKRSMALSYCPEVIASIPRVGRGLDNLTIARGNHPSPNMRNEILQIEEKTTESLMDGSNLTPDGTRPLFDDPKSDAETLVAISDDANGPLSIH